MRNVLNTLRVLDEVAARQPVGVGEVARLVGMPKSSVQRALATLRTAGWIRPAGGEVTKWVMTTKALRLSHHSTELTLRDAAVPIMEDLRAQTHETIHLMVPEGTKIVLIERLQTPQPVRIVLPLGISLPMHASANGKAILAHSSPEAVNRLLAESLQSFTETTITDPAGLLDELERSRQRGYTTNSGEWRSDIAAVAAAVFDTNTQPIASLSISTPSLRMPDSLRAQYGALVARAARTLSAALGHHPANPANPA